MNFRLLDFILRICEICFFIFLIIVALSFLKVLFKFCFRVKKLEEKVEELSNPLEFKKENNEK